MQLALVFYIPAHTTGHTSLERHKQPECGSISPHQIWTIDLLVTSGTQQYVLLLLLQY